MSATDSGAAAPVAGTTTPAASSTGPTAPTTVPTQGAQQTAEQVAAAAAAALAASPPSSDPLSLDAPTVTAAALPPTQATTVGKTVTYEPTGDAKLDMSLAFLGKLGIEPTHPGMVAAGNGDFSILKAHLSTLGDKAVGWEANIALGESAVSTKQAADKERATKDRAAMLDAVGGEAQWNQVREYARKATEDSPTEREEVNRVLKSGGLAGKAMAVYLHGLFVKNSDSKEPAAAVATNGGAAASASQPPTNTSNALSPREYTAAVAKLNAEKRGRIDGTPELAALRARRMAWRERG